MRWILTKGSLFLTLTFICVFPVEAQIKRPSADQWKLANGFAMLAAKAGDYAEATELAEEALKIARIIFNKQDKRYLISITNLGNLYHEQGRYRDAEPLLGEAFELSRITVGRHPDALRAMSLLGALYTSEGLYSKAEPLLLEALKAQRELLGASDEDIISTLNRLGTMYFQTGRAREAEPRFRELVQIMSKALGPEDKSTLVVLSNLAQTYHLLGRYGEAVSISRDVLRARRATLGFRHPDTIAELNNLATILGHQGRHEDAEQLLLEALSYREALPPLHPLQAKILNNLGTIYMLQQRFPEAELINNQALQKSRQIFRRYHPEIMIPLNNLAAAHRAQGHTKQAESYYREVLAANSKALGPRHPNTLTSMANLAVVLQSEGHLKEAEALDREALKVRLEVLGGRHPGTVNLQLNLVRTLFNRGQHAEAVQILGDIESNILDWIGQEVYSTIDGAVRRQLTPFQNTFQDLALSVATTEKTYKAAWLAATVMLRFKILQGEEEAYLARLTRKSQDPRVQMLADEVGKLRLATAAAVRGVPNEFQKTLQLLESKQRALAAASSEYNDHLQVRAANLDAVRAALPADTILIEFRQFHRADFRNGNIGEPRFAAMLLTSNEGPFITDLGSVSDVQQLSASLNDGSAAKLYQLLFAAFEAKLTEARTVYVAPDGILNLVPFARLRLPDGRYWWERQEVHLLQTGRDLLRYNPDHLARGLLALGGIDFGASLTDAGEQESIFFAAAGSDRSVASTRAAATFRDGFAQLPATADEVKDVKEWYQLLRTDEPAEVWSGVDASKGRLMALKAPPRVLHLATHGFYQPNDSREPMLLSGIALAGANRELAGTGTDGLLFALEAEGLNLGGTELVVLSACDTAQGGLDYSEGVFGLARALHTAGARNVLVTLWKLQDGEAHDFMVDFYKNWLTQDHSDPAKALRDTQLSWMKQDNRRDPRVWAPYVLVE
jgi:CHAT domain-containing protein/Flp pilus assembly protein TadD